MTGTVEGRPHPVVFVVEQGYFDYTPARVFAPEIRFLSAPRLSPNGDPAWQQRVIVQISKELKDYTPGVDFVIPTGQPARMMLVAMIMREKGTFHNILGWDDRSQRYMLYALDLSTSMPDKARLSHLHV